MSDAPSLDDLLAPRPLGDGLFEVTVPDGWQQGRGAFGGLVLGAMLRAVQRAEADGARRVRAVTGEIAAPVLAGSAELRVEALRRGTGVSTYRATLTQGGEAAAQLVAVLGAPRPGAPAWQGLEAPRLGRWEDAPVVPFIPSVTPPFARHFEYRSVGPAPFTAGDEARAEGWVRPRAAPGERDAALAAALVDAYWPAAMARFDAPRPMSTIAFTMEMAGGFEGLDPGAPLYHRATTPVIADGFAVEFRELWGADGRLVALNQQTFVVIK